MTRLSEITPVPLTSTIERNWRADVPVWFAGLLVAFPALFLAPPLNFLFLGCGVAAAMGTELILSRRRARDRERDAFTPPPEFPEPPPFDPAGRAEVWRTLTSHPQVQKLVLFSYGTCVVLTEESPDPVASAKQLLQKYGHSVSGTPSADSRIYSLPESGSFVIGSWHPNILTYVPGELLSLDLSQQHRQLEAAFLGRSLRSLDTFSQSVVYVCPGNSE